MGPDKPRVVVYIQQHTHHNGRRRGEQKARESTLTVKHSCHRPRIPIRHVLIERRCGLKHCTKREEYNKEMKDQPTTNNKKVPFQKHNKITERVRIVIRWNSSCRVFKIHNNGRRGHRKRKSEYTYCSAYLSPPPYSIWTRPD